jgi:HEAT repeats
VSAHALLVAATEVLAALLVLTLVVTYGHSAAGTLRARLLAGRIAAARRAIAVVADTGELTPDAAAALRRLPFATRVDVIAGVAPSLAGEPRAALTRAARDSGLVAGAERRCASRSWRRRFRAVRLLTALGGGDEAVPPLLADRRLEVRTQAAQWAGEHPTPENVGLLVGMLGDDALLARFTVQDALGRVGPAAAPALVAAIRTAHGDALLGALRVARGVPDATIGLAARERADDPDPYVRASVAVLLGQTGGADGIAALERLLGDEAGAVRAAAVAALGRLGHWPAGARIAACLRDRDWEVRRQAALALRTFGAVGTVLLRRAARDEDRFSRDMATLALDLPDAAVAAP